MRRRRDSVTLALALFTTASAWASTATIDFDTSAAGYSCSFNRVPPLFNRPGYASNTAGYVATYAACDRGMLGVDFGNDSLLQNAAGLHLSSPNSNEVRWSWVDPADNNAWLRLLTLAAQGVYPERQSPCIYLAAPASISMDVLVTGYDASHTASTSGGIEIGLGLRETGAELPLGASGPTAGPVEFVGFTGTGGSGTAVDTRTPVGGVYLGASLNWYHLEWVIVDSTHVDVYVNDPGRANPTRKSVVAFPGSGDGVLSSPNNRGQLDALIIRKPVADTVTKQWFLNVDNIVLSAPGVTDPLYVSRPLCDLQTRLTVSSIHPSATRVNLYRTPGGGSPALLAFATSPPADFSSGMHVFSGLTMMAGDTITATQVIGGVEGENSPGVPVTNTILLEDFGRGASYAGNPVGGGRYREWYATTSLNYGSCWFSPEACLRYIDSSYLNGVYSIFDAVFPAARNDYHLLAKVQIVEGTDSNAIRRYQMGAVVNGQHRDVTSYASLGSNSYACHGQSLLAVNTELPGNAVASYQGLDAGINTGAQTLDAGPFAANANDNLLVVFSTNVQTMWSQVALDTSVTPNILDSADPCEVSSGWIAAPVRNAQGTWNYDPDRSQTSTAWGGGYVLVHDIRVTSSAALSSVPAVSVMPVYCPGRTRVAVTGVMANASTVQVYAGGQELLGTANGYWQGVWVDLVRPLAAGETICATQTVNGVEGSRALAPTRQVADCRDVPGLSVVQPLNAGATVVTVSGVSSEAWLIEVFDGTTKIGSLSTGIVAGTNVVPVTPLIKGHMITATQRIECTSSCTIVAQCVGSGHNGRVRLSVGLRESTGLSGPAGTNAHTKDGTIEWLIPVDGAGSGVLNTCGVPQGKLVIPGPDWQTVVFDRNDLSHPANVAMFTGDGALASSGWAILENLAIAMDSASPDVGPYTMWIDNIANGGPPFETFEDGVAGQPHTFRPPTYSGSTTAYLLTSPDEAQVVDTVADGAGRSNRVSWRWDREEPCRWLRLTTNSHDCFYLEGGAPEVDLANPISVRVLLPCPGPVITAQPSPADQVVTSGCVSYSVAVSGDGPFAYQWYKGEVPLVDGGAVSGSTSATLNLCPITPADSGEYSVRVTDPCGSVTSSAARLSVPCLSLQWLERPTPNQVVAKGTTVALRARAGGEPAPQYQWRKDGVDLVDGSQFSGVTTDTLTISDADPADGGTYECVAGNGCGAVGSITVQSVLVVSPSSVRIIAWRSLKTHSGFGEMAITLNAAATATGQAAGGIRVESRNSSAQNGLTRIQVDFDAPVVVVDASKVTVKGASTTGCSLSGLNCVMGAVGNYTPSSVIMTGTQTMTVAFANSSLPRDACYVITIGQGAVSAPVEGDADCKVRVLHTDCTSDGLVGLGDLALVKSRFNQAITAANCASDPSLATGISLIDLSMTKSRFGRRALCP